MRRRDLKGRVKRALRRSSKLFKFPLGLAPPTPTPSPVPPPDNGYWRSTIRLILVLLAIWAFVSIGAGILFVRPLNALTVGRLPAGFWMAQQGSILVFVGLIYIFARRMDALDRRYGKDREDSEK